MSKTITLGGVDHRVDAVPLGRLKVLIPALTAFSRSVAGMASTSHIAEQDLQNAVVAIAAGLGKSPVEVEDMPCTLNELIAAIEVLAEVSGLMAKGDQPGESLPGTTPATTSTPSTDSSPTS